MVNSLFSVIVPFIDIYGHIKQPLRRQKYEKALALALVFLVSTSLLVACGGKPNNNNAGNTAAPETSGSVNETVDEAFEFSKSFIENKLTGNYKIVYNVATYTNGESDSATLELIWTPEGFYFASKGEGMLFIKDGDSYKMQVADGDGGYFDVGVNYPIETAEAFAIALTNSMAAYADYAEMSGFERDGSENIAGRDCARYSYKRVYPGVAYAYDYKYWIDKDTGVCLKVKFDVDGQGEKIGYEFECLEFQTSGVSLPSFKLE